MKFQGPLQAFGFVALLLGSLVSATPANGAGLENVEARGLTNAEIPEFTAFHKRDLPLALTQVINNASYLFATQLVGSANTLGQLHSMCEHYNTSRLASLGYNVTIIRQVICDAAALPALQSNQVIMDRVAWYDTEIFITQLNATFQGNHFAVCDFFTVPIAGSVGLNGSEVEGGFQCTLPNDGPSSTSTSPPAVIKRRAIATRAAGSPGPTYGYTLSAEPTSEYIHAEPTAITSEKHHPGQPIVTPSAYI